MTANRIIEYIASFVLDFLCRDADGCRRRTAVTRTAQSVKRHQLCFYIQIGTGASVRVFSASITAPDFDG